MIFLTWHFVTRFGLNPAYCDFLFDLCMVVSRHTFGLNPGEASALDVYMMTFLDVLSSLNMAWMCSYLIYGGI